MAVQAILAGTDVTEHVQEGSVTKKHNNPAQASIKLPSHLASAGDTARLKILVDGGLDFHGSVEYIEHQGDEDTRYSTYTAVDPTHIFNWRVVADADGDYSKPSIIENFVTGPQIMAEAISNSITQFGPMGLVLGSVASGGANLTGAPTNWPKTTAELQTLLVETGELDVVCSPIDSGGDMGSVSLWNGNYGSNLSGSVSFQYGSGSFNARACRVTIDKKELVNRMRYLLGPRVGTAADPPGDQHWRAAIDHLTAGLPFASTINAAATASRSAHFNRFLVRIFDARGDEATVGRELYKYHFAREIWMRLQPKLMFHITPERGIAPAFGTGDLIGVSGFGISGTQRVMEYTYRWTADGPIELGEPVGQAGAAAVTTTGIMEGLS